MRNISAEPFVAFLSSCAVWPQVIVARGLSCATACGILVPQPGIEPMSPALAGGFLTTGPPGKSQDFYF